MASDLSLISIYNYPLLQTYAGNIRGLQNCTHLSELSAFTNMIIFVVFDINVIFCFFCCFTQCNGEFILMNSIFEAVRRNDKNSTKINLSHSSCWENEVKLIFRNEKFLYGLKLLYNAMLIKHDDSSVGADSFGKSRKPNNNNFLHY